MSLLTLVALLLLAAGGASNAFAVVCDSTWSGGAGDGSWSNPANWDAAPGAGDIVCLTGATVTYDAPTAIFARIDIDDSTLTVADTKTLSALAINETTNSVISLPTAASHLTVTNLDIASGSALQLERGVLHMNTGGVISGGGNVTWGLNGHVGTIDPTSGAFAIDMGGGGVNIVGAASLGNVDVTLTAGTIAYDTTLEADGTLTLNGGFIDPSGTAELLGTGNVIWNAGFGLTAGAGTVIFDGPTVHIADGVTADIKDKTLQISGGKLELGDTTSLARTGAGTLHVMTTGGQLANDGGDSTVAVPVANDGNIAVVGGHLTITGALSNFAGGTLTNGGYLLVGGGILRLNVTDITTLAHAAVQLAGASANITTLGGVGVLGHITTIDATSNVTIGSAGALTNSATIANAGAITVLPGGTLTTTGYNQDAGTLAVQSTGTANVGTATLAGGALSSSGSLIGNITNTGSSVQTVDPDSVIDITGTYTQSTLGELALHVTDATHFDQLHASGNVTLGALLTVDTTDYVAPGYTDTFSPITSGTVLSGTFSAGIPAGGIPLTGQKGIRVAYNPDDVTFSVDDIVAPTAPGTPAATDGHTATLSNDNTIALAWTAASDGVGGTGIAGYSYVFDHSPTTTPDSVSDGAGLSTTSAPLSDGAWYFHVRAIDGDGNAGPATHSTLFHIDTTAPTTPGTPTSTDHTAAASSNSTIHMTWAAATDTNGAGYSYLFDHTPSTTPDATAEGTTPAATSTALADGTWYFHVLALDAAGNVSAAAHSIAFVIDTTAPAAPTLTGTPGQITGARSATFTFSATGATQYACSLDGAAATPCTSPKTYAGLTAKHAHTFTVTATDAAGNTGAARTYTWTVAGAPAAPTHPTIKFLKNGKATLLWTKPATTALAPVTKYVVAYAGKTVTLSRTSLPESGQKKGKTYSFTVKAVGPGGTSAAVKVSAKRTIK